jgi:hypothetical protein
MDYRKSFVGESTSFCRIGTPPADKAALVCTVCTGWELYGIANARTIRQWRFVRARTQVVGAVCAKGRVEHTIILITSSRPGLSVTIFRVRALAERLGVPVVKVNSNIKCVNGDETSETQDTRAENLYEFVVGPG